MLLMIGISAGSESFPALKLIYICMKYLFIILTALYSCWFRNLNCRFTYSCWNRGTICSLALFIYINFYFSILLFLLRFYMGNHIILSWLGKFYMEPKKRHFYFEKWEKGKWIKWWKILNEGDFSQIFSVKEVYSLQERDMSSLKYFL